MEITSKWIEKYRFQADNGRHSAIDFDTPQKYGGEDSAPSALEVAIMALAACLGTTYKMTADHMHLSITALEVKAIANKSDDMHLSDVNMTVKVTSKDPKEKLEQCLELAEKNCPVDIIFHQTEIPIIAKLIIVTS
ncbi:MAG: OsmC family protein [Candidatus Heimdallarchaeota archaeon]